MDHRTRPSPSGISLPPAPSPVAGFLFAIALFSPVAAWGQPMERGAFHLYLDGELAGREDFEIRRSGTGDAQITLARGTVNMRDGRVVETVLHMRGPGMTLIEYRVDVTGADTATVRFERVADDYLRMNDNYLRMNIVEPQGERGREYRARPMTFILEEGVAHHYFVLGMFTTSSESATLHTFAPLAKEPETTTELEVAPETLELGGETIETTRVRLGSGEGGATAWFNGSGDLVQVELPAKRYRATWIR